MSSKTAAPVLLGRSILPAPMPLRRFAAGLARASRTRPYSSTSVARQQQPEKRDDRPQQTLKQHFWLRAESKPGERRSILLPEHVERLLKAGHRVTVERSRLRCAADEEYERVLPAKWPLVRHPPTSVRPFPSDLSDGHFRAFARACRSQRDHGRMPHGMPSFWASRSFPMMYISVRLSGIREIALSSCVFHVSRMNRSCTSTYTLRTSSRDRRAPKKF